MSLVDDIVTFIAGSSSIATSFGTTITAGTNLFISFEPTSPDSVITIYPYGGARPALGSKYKYNSSVQVRFRSASFQTAYETGQATIDAMHYNGDVISNSNGVVLANNSQPQFLYRDEDKRSILICNFSVLHVRY